MSTTTVMLKEREGTTMISQHEARGIRDQVPASSTGRRTLLPLTGVAAVGLVIAAHLVHGSVPGATDPVDKVAAFYRTHDSSTFVGSALLVYAAFFYIAFAAVLRKTLRGAEDEGGGASAFGFAGAVVFAVGLTITAGIGIALGHAPAHLDPIAIQALHALFFNVFAPLGAGCAIFLVGNGLAIVNTGALPRWLGWLAVPVGLLGLAPEPVGDVALFGLGVWTLIVSALLMARRETAS